MLVACGTMSPFVLPVGALIFLIVASLPVGLAALTSVMFKRGLEVPAIRKISRANMGGGLLLVVAGLALWPPLAIVGALVMMVGAVTARLNASRAI